MLENYTDKQKDFFDKEIRRYISTQEEVGLWRYEWNDYYGNIHYRTEWSEDNYRLLYCFVEKLMRELKNIKGKI